MRQSLLVLSLEEETTAVIIGGYKGAIFDANELLVGYWGGGGREN